MMIRSLLGALALTLCLSPMVTLRAQDPPGTGISYEQAREAWLKDRLISLKRGLILQEELLTCRIQGIVEEGARLGILPPAELDALLADEAPHILTSEHKPTRETDMAERLDYWMERQQELLADKLTRAWDLRRRLSDGAAPDILHGMFRRDLSRAVDAYAGGQAGLAGAQFQDILDLYPYSNMDDVRFFRAEAALEDGAWDTAVEHYLVLLRTEGQSDYRAPAFRHLLYLRALFGQHRTAVAECDEFAGDLEKASGDVAYLCGREFFMAQRYREAQLVLARVGSKDAAHLRARHLTGLCLILENHYDDAIGVFEGLLEDSPRLAIAADKDLAFREDARLKLGYLYFEAGRIPEASRMFDAVAKGGLRHPEALLGQAWSDLSLANPDRALSLSRELVDHYPASPFRYEAMTLAGFASEDVNRDEAKIWYGRVLEEAQRSESMRELGVERRQVLQMMRRLVDMEPRVFGGEGERHFDEYLRLRGECRVLMNRAKYTELKSANASMTEYIDERQQVAVLARRLRELLKGGLESANPAEAQEMALLNRDVQRLMKKVRLAGLLEIQRQPLMIHERTLASVNSMLDSLGVGSSLERAELGRKVDALQKVEGGNRKAQLAHSIYKDRFSRLERDVEQVRSQAARLRRKPVTSNLPRWSELAFSRLAIGDIDFDELKRIEDRLDELDGYLESIDGLLKGDAPSGEAKP
jgi:tetratricopeptide (TPR) repeat protein